jgi:hypothetical protein
MRFAQGAMLYVLSQKHVAIDLKPDTRHLTPETFRGLTPETCFYLTPDTSIFKSAICNPQSAIDQFLMILLI